MAAEDRAIILAGGKSKRLGRDKASEVLLEVSLLQRVLDTLTGLVGGIVIVAAPGQRLPEVTSDAELTMVEDAYPETGPLGGLYTGLATLTSSKAIAVACDMPLLQPRLLQELLRLSDGYDAVVPLWNEIPQPLCAVYSRSYLEPLRRRLDAGALRVTGFYDDLSVRRVTPEEWRRFDPEGLSFLNVNTEADLRRAEGVLRDRGVAPPA